MLGPAFLGRDSTGDALGVAFGSKAVLYQARVGVESTVTDLGDITPNTWHRISLEVRRKAGAPDSEGAVFVTIDESTVQVPLVSLLISISSGATAGITTAIDEAATLHVDDFVFFNEP